MSNHYETLNVTRDAEDVVIESAYRALMKRYHPDKTNGDPIAAERAKEINAAYSTLRDRDTRARYDHSLPDDSASFRSPPERSWSPEPTPYAASSTPAKRAPNGGLASMVFIGLAVLIGVGAVGSLMRWGSNGGSEGTVTAESSPPVVSTGDSSQGADGTSDEAPQLPSDERTEMPPQSPISDQAAYDGEGQNAPPSEQIARTTVTSDETDSSLNADGDTAGSATLEVTPEDLDGLY